VSDTATELVKALFIALVAGGGSGLAWLLVTYRSQRRRIDAGAQSDEANAASKLSGAALDMVREARAEASAARREVAELRGMLTAERQVVDELRHENTSLRTMLAEQGRHVDRLVRLIQAAGIELPSELDPRRGGTLGGTT
jgi:hypothetical protein